MLRALKISLSIVLLVVLVVHLPGVNSLSYNLAPREGHVVEEGKTGAVASESAICSRHGTDILKQGGNAADAVSDIPFSCACLYAGQ